MSITLRASLTIPAALALVLGGTAIADEALQDSPSAGVQVPADSEPQSQLPAAPQTISSPQSVPSVSQSSLPAPVALSDDAEVTLSGSVLCAEPYFSANAITVDLSTWADIGASDTLVIGTDAAASCLSNLTSVSFIRSTEGVGFRNLEIQDSAFRQSLSQGDNKLASVSFPEGLDALTIGEQAFYQLTSRGKNSLSTLTFSGAPRSLSIGKQAFYQYASTGGSSLVPSADNALTAVVFPVGIQELTIADQAFEQHVRRGPGNNALATLSIPEGLTELVIAPAAFRQSVYSGDGENALAALTFPESLSRLAIGRDAFAQEHVTGSHGSNALAVVQFPATLDYLKIDAGAFSQTALGSATVRGDNALHTVIFPDYVTQEHLLIGEETTGAEECKRADGSAVDCPGAFAQHAQYGSNALTTVELPEGPTKITIGERTFRQEQRDIGANKLSLVRFPTKLQQLNIGYDAFSQQSAQDNTLSTVEFPEGLQELSIGNVAFLQHGTNNALTSMNFPEGLKTLNVGVQGVTQRAWNGGNNKLASISFPSTLKSLDIALDGFKQQAYNGGNNALSSVAFPDGIEHLSIGKSAFYQRVNTGGVTALRSVIFPDQIDELILGSEAFSISTSAEDLFLFFRSQVAPAQSIFLDYGITKKESTWIWLGGDKTQTSAGWTDSLVPDSRDYLLRGARTASFETNGGTLSDGSPFYYVFPTIDGEPQASADATELKPEGFRAEEPEFIVVAPNASRDDAAFNGWCSTAWAEGECTSLRRSAAGTSDPGEPLSVPAPGGTYSAGWQVTPPPPAMPEVACDIVPVVQVPEGSALFFYETDVLSADQEGNPTSLKVSARTELDYVQLDGDTEWSFAPAVTPCSPNPGTNPDPEPLPDPKPAEKLPNAGGTILPWMLAGLVIIGAGLLAVRASRVRS